MRDHPQIKVLKGRPLPPLSDRSHCFTDEEMESICRAIRAPGDAESRDRLRQELVNAGMAYLMSTDTYAETRASEAHREIQQIARVLAVLADLLERISGRARQAAWVMAMELAKAKGETWFDPPPLGQPQEQAKEQPGGSPSERAPHQVFCDIKGVYRLEAIFSALARLPSGDRGGPVRDRTRDFYILRLAEVFEATTGRDARFKLTYDREEEGCQKGYRSPFLDFVRRNLDIVQPDHNLGKVTLGNIVRRVLRERTSRRTRPVVGANVAPDPA